MRTQKIRVLFLYAIHKQKYSHYGVSQYNYEAFLIADQQILLASL